MYTTDTLHPLHVRTANGEIYVKMLESQCPNNFHIKYESEFKYLLPHLSQFYAKVVKY